ncbi:hypothetical protein AAC387_Pa05g3415 [Persea americana]
MEREAEDPMDIEKTSAQDKNEEDVLLPGFRFHPTDEELVGFYLQRKVDKIPLSIEIIKQIDIYKYDPWDLPKVSTLGDKEWYFFCLRGRKYKNSIRPNRVTGSGFWKATGIDRPIYAGGERANDCIGLKKSLVYYRGSAGKGTKTDWMMHEFRLPPSTNKSSSLTNATNNQEAEVWTICRIFKRTVSYKKYTPGWSDSSSIKRHPTDANSKSCSFESDDGEKNQYFGTSSIQQTEKKPFITVNEDKQLLSDQYNPIAQAPSTALCSSFPSTNSNDFFRQGNWDELGAIVEVALDPLVYGYRY